MTEQPERYCRSKLAIAVVVTLSLSGCVRNRIAGSTAHYSGGHLYQVYCSSCHGLDGHGSGSVAPYTSARAPDLTQISIRNGGKFPRERVFRTIDGQFDSPAPDARHMPIWGYDLFTGEGDDETAHQQVLDMEHRIVRYVESLQERSSGPAALRR
jgi:mono/diheme cytochrome c family protein